MRYKTIESKSDLLNVKCNIKNCLIYIIPETYSSHSVNYKVSLALLKDIDANVFYIIALNHSEYISEIVLSDLKDALQHTNIISLDSKKDFHILGKYPSLDINILSYISSLEILDVSSTYYSLYNNFYQNTFHNLSCSNCFVPSGFYMELFDGICSFYDSTITDFKNELSKTSYLGTFELNKCLANIECSGICIDVEKFKEVFDKKLHGNIIDNKIFSEYSLFTSTGRPSNKFGGINFAALNKKDDTRSCFISRFENDGLLFDIDFQACHPNLIAKLIGYDIPKGINIYEYLGRCYFNKSELSVDELEKSKSITFQQLYGHVDKQFQNIPFFKKKIEYNNRMVEFFRKTGYIETPLFKRKLNNKNFGEENAEKMFAYLLQSYETEVNILKSKKILNILNGFQSKLVLYTYDSFLIDFCKRDPKELILKIKTELESDGMPVSIKAGVNYKDLKKITM